jgi:2-(1,2-epoxy-1,2-dihydrophenyl)acetyl-CoA isomerase
VIAAESAKFMSAAVRVGMAPDAGSSVTLPQIVGVRKALEIFLTNPTLSATDAYEIGLITKVVPDDDLQSEALKLARTIAEGAPLAMAATKRLGWSGIGGRVEAQLPEEARTVSELSGTADSREGLAAVLERRTPKFIGR